MLLVDSHVHFHSCFPLAEFLSASAENFRKAAAGLDRGSSYQPVLCLTETARASWFQTLCENQGDPHFAGRKSGWEIKETSEPRSLLLDHAKFGRLFVIAGRQIVTRERLEILALGTEQQFLDGEGIRDTIEAVLQAGALPVLPWGFGKWLGGRGQTVQQLVGMKQLYLGDNGGRPAFWPYPSEFRQAESMNIPVLPGSDPLPFEQEYRRPGSYGFALDASLSDAKPASELVRLLSEHESVRPYGDGETIYRFCRNQVAMQFKKRSTYS